MGRIIENKLNIPKEVICGVDGSKLSLKGPKGINFLTIDEGLIFENDVVTIVSNQKALLKTRLTLVKNAIKGVLDGFDVSVMLYGVGYKVVKIGNSIEFSLGYSHPIKIIPPSEIDFEIKSPTQIIFKSCSKMLLGDFVAKVTKLRKQNPYKTKGVIKEGSFIRKKEGKK